MIRKYSSQRMQINSAWTETFQFVLGYYPPYTPQPLAGWNILGTIMRANLPSTALDLIIGDRLSLDSNDTSIMTISLIPADTLALGVGTIVTEILRMSPLPIRPILKFYIDNHPGEVDNYSLVVTPHPSLVSSRINRY